MRIAIPIYGDLISPRFDCATRLVVAVQGEDGLATGEQYDLATSPGPTRAAFLVSLGVQALLCGGIRRCDYYEIEEKGIRLVVGLTGEWRQLLTDFLADRLPMHTLPWMSRDGANKDATARGRNGGRCRQGCRRGR